MSETSSRPLGQNVWYVLEQGFFKTQVIPGYSSSPSVLMAAVSGPDSRTHYLGRAVPTPSRETMPGEQKHRSWRSTAWYPVAAAAQKRKDLWAVLTTGVEPV